MYEYPTRLLVQQMETSIREQQEKQIFEAIQKCGVDVNRDELIKALSYDRDQYDKGYADGRADAQRWISVEERLPEECLYVIVYLQGKIHNDNKDIWHMDADYFEDGDWHRYPENGYYKPTHWMPIPQPPEEPA